jgi:hypothetical protein
MSRLKSGLSLAPLPAEVLGALRPLLRLQVPIGAIDSIEAVRKSLPTSIVMRLKPLRDLRH